MQITSGRIESAQKVVVFGPEGIGKSTFAARFPDPLFIDTEGSTKHLDVKRLDAPHSWTMLLEEVRFVIVNPDSCSTLIVDTADWAERLCIAHVCAKHQAEGIEAIGGGYGKGYTYLAEEFGNLLNLLSEVADRGINVVMTAHAWLKKFEQPDEAGAYDRWELKLGKKSAPMVKEWADAVLFANYKTYAVKDSKTGSVKAQGGHRVMYASHHPAWDAKNRWGLADEVDFDFSAIAAHIPAKPVKGSPETSVTDLSTAPVAEAVAEDATPSDEKAEAEAPAEAKLPATSVPEHLEKLFQLMAKDGVHDTEVRAAVGLKGYYTRDTAIEKYDPAFVSGSLVAAWPQLLEVIKQIRKDNEDIPF